MSSRTRTLVWLGGYFWSCGLEFNPQDLWFGVFWRSGRDAGSHTLDLWVCLLPCLPLHIRLIAAWGR
jgi:hypothetical protein